MDLKLHLIGIKIEPLIKKKQFKLKKKLKEITLQLLIVSLIKCKPEEDQKV